MYRKFTQTQELLEYLCEQAEKYLDPEEQEAFAKKCLGLMIQQPKIPKALQADISRYKSGKMLPGRKKLNSCFRELGLPFEITSVQKSVDGKRQTYWIVKNVIWKENHKE